MTNFKKNYHTSVYRWIGCEIYFFEFFRCQTIKKQSNLYLNNQI
jgi:hypothetical protein